MDISKQDILKQYIQIAFQVMTVKIKCLMEDKSWEENAY